MKTVNLLLASSDRRVNNIVEAAVRDVCFEQAVVECTRATGVDEFLRQSNSGWVDLIMVEPDNLLPTSKRRGLRPSLEQAADAIRSLKSQRSTPVVALNVAPQNQMALLEAGVDNTFAFPLDSDALKTELRRLLNLSEPVEAAPSSGWSLAGSLRRGWQRLTNAKGAQVVE
jgi:hypothetical protein